MRRHLRSALIIIVAWSVARLLVVAPVTGQFARILDLGIYDTALRLDRFFKARPNMPVYDSIVIVDIDDKSLAQLGQFSQWPTQYFADANKILSEDYPKLIAYDVMFADSSSFTKRSKDRLTRGVTDPVFKRYTERFFELLNGEEEFSRSISEAGNVFLAMFNNPNLIELPPLPSTLKVWNVDPRYALSATHPHPPLPQLAEAAYGVGFAQVTVDESGKIHDFPLFIRHSSRHYVNFGFQACLDLMAVDSIRMDGKRCRLLSKGKQIGVLPLSPQGRFYLRYPIQDPAFRKISFVDLLNRRVAPGYFAGKIVMVGSSATGLGDIKNNPFSSQVPGVEIHATFIRNVIESEFVKWNHPIWDIFWLALLLGVLLLLIKTGKPLIQLAWVLSATLALFAYFGWLYTIRGSTMNYSGLLMPWILCSISLVYDHYGRQVRERKQVHDAFEHYVSRDVIREVMKGKNALKIGGTRRYVSALIADVRAFSYYCEKCEVDEITRFINHFFNRSTQIILNQKGLLDKFMGDAVLALFNVPYATPDYAILACRAALQIRTASNEIAGEYQDHPVLSGFRIGVGISSGEAIVGNIGSDSIFNYTGIGTTMNMCSRLEALNKVYQSQIIVDESTYRMASDDFVFRHLDYAAPSGMKQPVHLYELLAEKNEGVDVSAEFLAAYEQGVEAILATDFDRAKTAFLVAQELCPQDYATQLMIERLEIMNWETWDGVWQHAHK